MSTLIVAALAALAGAAIGIGIDRAGLRRWIRRRATPGGDGAPETSSRAMSARRALEDSRQRIDRSEAATASAQTEVRRLEASLDVLRSGVVLSDRSGQVVACNTAASVLLAARHGEALVAGVIKDLLARAGAGEKVSTNVELHAEPRRNFEVEARPVERDGETLGAVALVHDVTEHHRIESVRRDFVANVSHELKTPVGALSLLADSLSSDPEPEVASRLANRMQIEIQRAAATIDDLLTLAMLEDESSRVRESVDMTEVVASACDRISETASKHDVKVLVTCDDGLAPLQGSRLQFESAVFNLLDNAVKYSEPGGQVDVSLATDPEQRSLVVSVSDEGIGIPASERSRIFERFYRVDRARSRSTGGTGLGLSIVRHVALNHDGIVNVESREGYGTTFTITLPLNNDP